MLAPRTMAFLRYNMISRVSSTAQCILHYLQVLLVSFSHITDDLILLLTTTMTTYPTTATAATTATATTAAISFSVL